MKASMLTFTQTGNTLKVGMAISQGLQLGGVEVKQVDFLHRNRWKPEEAELIGIGCPIFENRPVEVMSDYLAQRGFDFTGKKAFVFITSGGSPAKSLWHLSRTVNQTGATVIGGIQLRGSTTFPTLFGLFPGRPNANDLDSAKSFGQAVAANIMQGEALPAHYHIDPANGKIFYNRLGPILTTIKKKIIPLPVSDPSLCDLCGNCVYECPSESITITHKTLTFHPTCIVCYRCWHVCPKNAISMKFSPGNGWLERWLYSEAMERFFGDIHADEYVGSNLYKDVLARHIKLKYDRKNPTAEYEPSNSWS
jgi:ferredoxin/flavodoxin